MQQSPPTAGRNTLIPLTFAQLLHFAAVRHAAAGLWTAGVTIC